jgi:hypothetical protein
MAKAIVAGKQSISRIFLYLFFRSGMAGHPSSVPFQLTNPADNFPSLANWTSLRVSFTLFILK